MPLVQKAKRTELKNQIQAEGSHSELDTIVIIQDQDIRQDTGVVENGKVKRPIG